MLRQVVCCLLLLPLNSVHATDTTAVATNQQLCSLVKPFQLVSIDQTGKLSVTDAAKTLFDQCFKEEFHVVSVAGSFHTGKSFLLNALMNATGTSWYKICCASKERQTPIMGISCRTRILRRTCTRTLPVLQMLHT